MNNTINSANNVSFNSRYLYLNSPEKFPQIVKDAIYKSDAIDEFLRAGQPKTFWEKLVDLFRKNEILDVYFIKNEKESSDPHTWGETVYFSFKKGKDQIKTAFFSEPQKGELRPAGVIPKPGEHRLLKAPKVTASEKLAKKIDGIKDFESILV